MSVIVYGPVEQAVKQWLTGTEVAPLVQRSPGVYSIYLAMPPGVPMPVLLVSLVGGGPAPGKDLPITRWRLSFDALAATRDAASELARTLVGVLDSLALDSTPVLAAGLYLAAAQVLSVRWLPDPDSDTPRYVVDALITTVT